MSHSIFSSCVCLHENMGYSTSFLISFLLLAMVLIVTYGQPLVPALFIFGDSNFDVGNNNHLHTIVKANFPPYGRDFENHNPTGRFSNGKLIIDYLAESFGFTSYQPAYLSLDTKGKNLLNGANFASAASGYYDYTAGLYGTISLSEQLEYYKDCQNELMKIVGQSNALSIISGAIYLVDGGANDFILNYYQNPLLYKVYRVDQFLDILMRCYSNFIQNLYELGARKIGVITLSPIGCLPITITLFGSHGNECVARLNNDAVNFNKKLNLVSQNLQKVLPGLNLVLLDSYQPFYDLVTKPSKYGFSEARRGCCGTGLLEVSIACNQMSKGTCGNASEYVFWDSFHHSEAANKLLAYGLISDGISLIS